MAETNLDKLTGAMIEVKGRTYYVALLGVYETRAAAELAARNRPAALKRLEPYIRSMASLQSAMNRADSSSLVAAAVEPDIKPRARIELFQPPSVWGKWPR